MEFLRKGIVAIGLIVSFQSYTQESKSLPAAFSKSYALEAKGQYDAAITAIKDVYIEGSYTMNLRLGWLNYLQNKYELSIFYYQKASIGMPASLEPLWGILNPLVATQKWAEVDKVYLAILKLDPKNSTANYKLGLNYYYRKNYSKAKKYFDVALNAYPFDYSFLIISAWNNYFLGNTAVAKVLFFKVLLIDQNDKSAIEGLSLIK
jgi:tetratricopeptide (TPR) repeat protein